MKEYEKIVRKVELLQRDLMSIDGYSEEVYQAFEKLIDELEWVIEEGQEND